MKRLKDQLIEEFIPDIQKTYADREQDKMLADVREMVMSGMSEDRMVAELVSKYGIRSRIYFPQLLRKVQGLEESTLNEDYNDRLKLIIDDISQKHPEGIATSNLPAVVMGSASNLKVPEYRMGDKMMKELISDVRKGLAERGLLKRKKSATRPDLRLLAQAIERYAGEAFPDGDPIDMLMPWMKRNGFKVDVSVLDMAAKKYLGSKSYNDYLADLYADFTADNPGMYDLDPASNPWRESVEENIMSEVKKYFQDGNTFYKPDGKFIDQAPFPVKDFDMKAAVEAEKWFNEKYPEYVAADDADLDFGDIEDLERDHMEEAFPDTYRVGVTPYDNDFDDADIEKAQEIAKEEAEGILHTQYSDVLSSREEFFRAYDLEDIDGLASDIASDAIASTGAYVDEEGILANIDREDIKKFIIAKIKEKIGLTTENRDYYMGETINRIKTLAGIRK